MSHRWQWRKKRKWIINRKKRRKLLQSRNVYFSLVWWIFLWANKGIEWDCCRMNFGNDKFIGTLDSKVLRGRRRRRKERKIDECEGRNRNAKEHCIIIVYSINSNKDRRNFLTMETFLRQQRHRLSLHHSSSYEIRNNCDEYFLAI